MAKRVLRKAIRIHTGQMPELHTELWGQVDENQNRLEDLVSLAATSRYHRERMAPGLNVITRYLQSIHFKAAANAMGNARLYIQRTGKRQLSPDPPLAVSFTLDWVNNNNKNVIQVNNLYEFLILTNALAHGYNPDVKKIQYKGTGLGSLLVERLKFAFDNGGAHQLTTLVMNKLDVDALSNMAPALLALPSLKQIDLTGMFSLKDMQDLQSVLKDLEVEELRLNADLQFLSVTSLVESCPIQLKVLCMTGKNGFDGNINNINRLSELMRLELRGFIILEDDARQLSRELSKLKQLSALVVSYGNETDIITSYNTGELFVNPMKKLKELTLILLEADLKTALLPANLPMLEDLTLINYSIGDIHIKDLQTICDSLTTLNKLNLTETNVNLKPVREAVRRDVLLIR